MPGPVLFAVDDAPDAVGRVEAELRDRYSRDYTVICEHTPEAALTTLQRLADEGQLGRRWRGT